MDWTRNNGKRDAFACACWLVQPRERNTCFYLWQSPPWQWRWRQQHCLLACTMCTNCTKNDCSTHTRANSPRGVSHVVAPHMYLIASIETLVSVCQLLSLCVSMQCMHSYLCKVICCFIAAGWLIVGELLTYFFEKEKKKVRTFEPRREEAKNWSEKNNSDRSDSVQCKQNLRSYTQWASTVCLLIYLLFSLICVAATLFMIYLVGIYVSVRASIKALTHSNSLNSSCRVWRRAACRQVKYEIDQTRFASPHMDAIYRRSNPFYTDIINWDNI